MIRSSAGEQQSIPLADGQVEVLGQVDEKLATRAGPAGLDEAQVLGRDVRVQGQLQLAEAASPTPEADQLACGLGLLLGLDDHPIEVSGASAQVPLAGVAAYPPAAAGDARDRGGYRRKPP